ncbi:MAG TPA: tetratricopeptide repeat protein [Gemmataceae bacterium]|jgi:Flp pilus assembly protein TadD|nr:tetratricopeptide repeat protein [Gemmataceae bacterium]
MNDDVHANVQEATALVHQGRLTEAVSLFEQIIRLEPEYAHGHNNLAMVYLLQHRYDEAFARAERAIELDPQLAEPHATLSAIYLRRNQVEEALASSRRAIRLNPKLPEAYFHEARAHLKNGQFAEAIAVCREVLRFKPDYIDVEYVLGIAALKENRLEDALGSLSALLQKKPRDAQAHVNRALIWLLQGKYEEGWPEYEWRWRGHDFVTKPMWDGSPLDNKTIVLHAEQGLGDTLQYIRYAPLVKQRAARPSDVTVTVACQESLHKLLSRCAGIDELVTPKSFAWPADEHALLMSLPAILKTTVATIPAGVPYVFPDPALVDSWRGEIRAAPGLKIGIAWQGSPQHPDDRLRSIPLAEFAPLREVSGIHWFSLQKGPGKDQLANAPFDLVDLSPRLDETTGAFMDSAAVMMSLDLIITSDTAIPHLAGGLGVPVWVALQAIPDFRWLLERADSPWYPTMRLFRQSRRGDWQGVFERMARELTSYAAERKNLFRN